MFLQQVKQLAIQLVSVPVFVLHILPSGIKEPKASAEFPQAPSDAVFREYIQCVGEPGQKDLMRSLIIAT